MIRHIEKPIDMIGDPNSHITITTFFRSGNINGYSCGHTKSTFPYTNKPSNLIIEKAFLLGMAAQKYDFLQCTHYEQKYRVCRFHYHSYENSTLKRNHSNLHGWVFNIRFLSYKIISNQRTYMEYSTTYFYFSVSEYREERLGQTPKA